jgi:hypothetical protein
MPDVECASIYSARQRHVQDLAGLPRAPYREKHLNSSGVNSTSIVAPNLPEARSNR